MFKGKNILVIGGAGSIGQALVKKLINYQPRVIRVYSRDEYKQFIMQEELKEHNNIRFFLGDVRDKERLDRAVQDIDIIFDLAALKHVPACEYNPFEAVKTNIIGTQNVIECAIDNKVKRVIYTSSDKAVSPTNTMGATKLLAERLISSAYNYRGGVGTIFAAVRFGNVMGSRGSVIPLFQKQIAEHGTITITEPDMTRFMMSLNQAVNLTIKACELAKGGEVFVLKMPVICLKDLAEEVIESYCNREKINHEAVKIKNIGLRPGEKMFEELMSEDEAEKAIELDEMYVIRSYYNNHTYEGARIIEKCDYSSRHVKPLTKKETRKLLIQEGLID